MSEIKDKYGSGRVYEGKVKTPERALSDLMRLCSKSEKSSGDALRLMRVWGVPEAGRQGVLDKLVASKFIDDRRYAELYVREKVRLAGWGAYKIRQMLVGKGIAKGIIEEALAGIDKTFSENRLVAMLEKKVKEVKVDDAFKLKGRLIRYGMGLGYGYDDVLSAVENIIKDRD